MSSSSATEREQDRQTDRQTDGHTDRDNYRQTDEVQRVALRQNIPISYAWVKLDTKSSCFLKLVAPSLYEESNRNTMSALLFVQSETPVRIQFSNGAESFLNLMLHQSHHSRLIIHYIDKMILSEFLEEEAEQLSKLYEKGAHSKSIVRAG